MYDKDPVLQWITPQQLDDLHRHGYSLIRTAEISDMRMKLIRLHSALEKVEKIAGQARASVE